MTVLRLHLWLAMLRLEGTDGVELIICFLDKFSLEIQELYLGLLTCEVMGRL